ncbi:hypothetical protein TD95_005030 [Thielaviopsis punctulata]|uniref:Inactive metallocarboxypeptidase ECM14 n=1 Tax=Thielaviopsis punctulata TaxID=72032 RepID=A0A0F4ZDQ3_9PEZI|nr:hypothetical protein TD95_005030 [Thielaviopsis punctulata]
MRLNRALTLLATSVIATAAASGADSRIDSKSHRQSSALFSLLCGTPLKSLVGACNDHSSATASFHTRLASKYADHMLLRFNISSASEHDAFYSAIDTLLLDVWSVTKSHADVRVRAGHVKALMGLLPATLVDSHKVLSHDLSAHVSGTYPDKFKQLFQAQDAAAAAGYSDAHIERLATSDDLFFRDYQPLPVISKWMQLLQAMFPSYVRLVTIGHTYEGREITGLRVGQASNAAPTEPRKTILVTGGLHAREWISTSSVNYLAWTFVTRYGKDRVITKVLQSFDVVFVPVMNPDGFEYTWSTDRLWRKSRQPTPDEACRGLDLDHTFGFGWDGSSAAHTNPCSEGFAGTAPFEASESSQLAEWARNVTSDNSTRFIGLIDLHSYSQQVLYPYSYSCNVDPPNLENLEELAAGLTKAIRLADGEIYTVAPACEAVGTLSATSASASALGPRSETGGGSAIDWFYHEMGAHYSYQIKLQDTGIYGFLLPRDYIIPSGEEVLSAMKYFGDFLLGNNGIERFDVGGQKVMAADEAGNVEL